MTCSKNVYTFCAGLSKCLHNSFVCVINILKQFRNKLIVLVQLQSYCFIFYSNYFGGIFVNVQVKFSSLLRLHCSKTKTRMNYRLGSLKHTWRGKKNVYTFCEGFQNIYTIVLFIINIFLYSVCNSQCLLHS